MSTSIFLDVLGLEEFRLLSLAIKPKGAIQEVHVGRKDRSRKHRRWNHLTRVTHAPTFRRCPCGSTRGCRHRGCIVWLVNTVAMLP